MSQLRVLVLGVGSIGSRHLRNFNELGVEKLAACDLVPEQMEPLASELGVACFTRYEAALTHFHPDCVAVCTPPRFHVIQARQAVDSGAHVFIEKPISDTTDGIGDLQAAAAHSKRVVRVGYNLRFHRGLRLAKELVDQGSVGRIMWAQAEFGQYLPDWRPWQDYRRGYTARRELGGGILLDASHEFDYMMWLLGHPTDLVSVSGKVSSLEVDVEDSSTVLLRFPDGSHADIHVDFVQRQYSRSCKLVGEHGTILWDYTGQQLRIWRAGAKDWEIHDVAEDPNHMYLAELEDFLSRVTLGDCTEDSLVSAKDTLHLVLRAKASAASGTWERLEW